MFLNNLAKAKNISLSNNHFCDFSYDSSIENSYIENLVFFNNFFNPSIKNQKETNIEIDESLRRKDSAIELEVCKNSFSGYKNHLLTKNDKMKRDTHVDNHKVEFIIDEDSSEEECDDINGQEQENIFPLEMDPLKNKSSISQDQNTNLNSNSHFLYFSKSNNNHKNQNPIKPMIRNTLNIVPIPNKNSDQHQKLSFQNIISHHIVDNPKKVGKIQFSNNDNELKSSPIKYKGLDILKPILKKAHTQTDSVETTTKDLVDTQTVPSSLPPQKKKNVHFKSENEECPFKKFECPSNIVNLPIYIVDSNLEPFLEAKLIKIKGFTSKKKAQLPWGKNVILESVGLIDDETQEHDILRLTIQTRNLAFEKKVKVHMTFDNWETKEIREAKYRNSENSNQGIDKFILDIDTDCDGESVCNLQFAIQYLVNQQEFWDNNDGNNYVLKVDRTVRIPAKEIKSHPYCEGPVVRYKLKPGYHYPLFKSNLKEHPSADVPKDTIEMADTKDTNDHFMDSYLKSCSQDDIGVKVNPLNDTSLAPKISRLSVERNTIENLLAPTTSNVQENEEVSEDESNKEFFSWNEPILLRKPNTQKISQLSRMDKPSKGMISTLSSNSTTTSSVEEDTIKGEDHSTLSIPNSSKWNVDGPMQSLNEVAFQLPKHENWFKDAPSCIPFGSSPRKLYHHSNNFKWLNHSSSPSSSPYQGKNLLEKEREEEEKHQQKLNSKYSSYSPHLSSSSSRYMRNNLYGNNYDQSRYYHSETTPISKTIPGNSSIHGQNNNCNDYSNYNTNTFHIPYTKIPSKLSHVPKDTHYKGYELYPNSHLYATQDDFIMNRSFF